MTTRSKKYSEKIISVRRLASIEIPKMLKDYPQNSKYILSKFKEIHPGFCDDKIICKCKSSSELYPEWRHQVRWAIQDLKYNSIIKIDDITKFYSLRK